MASDAKACFSSKVEYLAVIRYLYLKGKTGNEIHGELTDVYGSSAPSYAQIKVVIITDLGQRQKSASNGENTTDLPETLQMPSLCYGVYYANLQDQLRTAIRIKRSR